MTDQPARYHRTPADIEAVQWTGTNTDALRAFAGSDFDTIDPKDRIEDPDQDAQLLVEASHWVGIKPGDWVVKYEGYFVAKADATFRAVWEPAAVPVPPPADQTARRDRIAEALYERERPPRDPAWAEAFAMDREVFEAMAAVLSLTAVERQFLTFALDLAADEMASRGDEFGDEDEAALETLRRVAAEEQPAETQGTTTDKAAALGLTDTDYRARSHAAAVATIRAAIPGMYAHVGFRLEDVLNEADEVQPPETQAHEPTHTWTVESPRRDNWASWGTTYDDRDWALESYEHSTKNAPARPFRLVRATTTYTIEAEHTPPTARPAVGEQPETQEAPRPHTLDGAAETEEKLDLTPTREARPECAHCWREIENRGTPNMGGPTHDNWVHVPGGFTVCFPQRGGDSPRAEPRTPE